MTSACGVRPVSYGDGPFIDLGMFAADGNVNWDWFLPDGNGGGAGPYFYASFSTSVLGAAALNSSRWWWRDFGAGGIWDMKVMHTTGNDVGIYSFQVDGLEVARLDGYSLVDINNIETVFSGIRIGPGRHKLTITMVAANPSSIGLRFYPAIQGVLFRRTAPIAVPPIGRFPRGAAPGQGGQVINLIPLFATGNTNWDTLAVSNNMANGYEMFSTSVVNAARWWDLDLAAGQWTLDLLVATFSSAGIISVQLDGVTQATIDTYSAGTVYAVRKTVTLSVPVSGTHTLKLLMATKNGSSSAFYGDISNLQLRQVAPSRAALPPRMIHFTSAWNHGNSGWSTFFQDGGSTATAYVYGGDWESSGAQNAAQWWSLGLTAGTWALDLLYASGPNRGIISVRIDDLEVGTIDTYGGSSTKNARTTLAGIAVPSTGIHKLSFVMATKNGSSSNYYGTITALGLRRTA